MRPADVTFLDDDFLLDSGLAVELYHGTAAALPIVDYHCHLPVRHIAEDHRFRSITELWLDGDHYRWRAMRANGVAERCCTGDASDWEKFEAWAATVPHTIRNPLYHWTHMELKRPFGIRTLLSPSTARDVYEGCNRQLVGAAFSALGLLSTFRVEVVCTTDDPADSLEFHEALAARQGGPRVYPTWRPDRVLDTHDPDSFNAWVARLEATANRTIVTLDDLLETLDSRHQAFHALGCRASDHGLETMYAEGWADADVAAAFDRLRRGVALDEGEGARLKSALLHRLARLDHARGWVQQFHLGALRDNNTRLKRALGRDSGTDSIGDFEMARPLARFLDRLDCGGRLARTLLFNLNPADNELFATMIGNFQDGSIPGKLQWGPGWWFLDQLDGMEKQLNALSNMGLFTRFVGMTTDSRSFLSYSRHEYFRRLLCNMLGDDVRRGRVPDDRAFLADVVRGICYQNAKEYFRFAC
ncbi:MAG: glucuronate isomerase [Bacteroidales bacterium]